MGEQVVVDPELTEKSKEINFADLALQIKEGSNEAEKTLYEFIKVRSKSFLSNRLRENCDLLEDIISESFLKIINKLKSDRLISIGDFKSYWLGIVKNTAREFIARRITEKNRNLPASTLEGYNLLEKLLNSSANVGNENANDPETELLSRERLQIAETLINSLTEKKDRRILKMFYLEGETKQEICEELDMSEGEFKNRKHRALKQIKEIYNNLQQTNGTGK